MSICSWVRGQMTKTQGTISNLAPVPSNRTVQETLVKIGDKESPFVGSKEWIGSVEVTYYYYYKKNLALKFTYNYYFYCILRDIYLITIITSLITIFFRFL